MQTRLKLNSNESLIIDSRVGDESLFLLGDGAAEAASLPLIRQISVIIGQPLPTPEYLDLLEKRLASFITKFGYDELTFSELILAFELNAVGYTGEIEIDVVRSSTKNIGIEYVSKVLENYMQLRKTLDRKIQNQLDGY